MSKRKSENSSPQAKRKAPEIGNKNEEFVNFLTQLSDYEKNVSNNVFKAKAYKKAAHTLAGLKFRITSGNEATKLPGIGKKIGEKIDEFISTGKLKKIEKIENDETSMSISLLTRVNGIGPVAARAMVEKGIKTLEDLKEIKETLSHAQQIGLKYFHEFEQRIPRAEIDQYRQLCEKTLRTYDEKLRFEICGSYRRNKDSSFDIDILICHPDFISSMKSPPKNMLSSLVDHLKGAGLLLDTLSLGNVKFMGVGRVPHGTARRVDVRVVPHDKYWCGVLYFTGSDVFNQEMRAHAISQGFTLNEYSLRPVGSLGSPGEPLEVSCEEDIFDYLGLPYQEPKTRTQLLTT